MAQRSDAPTFSNGDTAPTTRTNLNTFGTGLTGAQKAALRSTILTGESVEIDTYEQRVVVGRMQMTGGRLQLWGRLMVVPTASLALTTPATPLLTTMFSGQSMAVPIYEQHILAGRFRMNGGRLQIAGRVIISPISAF